MDSGPILLQKKINILPNETYLKLDKRLANVGLELLLEATPKYISGELQPTPQDDSQATICKKLTREDGKINWNKTTREIYNLYRGLTPWPGIWTTWQDKRLKLLKIKPAKTNIATGKVNIQDGILRIGTKDASIETLELQPEGKPEMDVKTFLNGYKHINNVSLITDHYSFYARTPHNLLYLPQLANTSTACHVFCHQDNILLYLAPYNNPGLPGFFIDFFTGFSIFQKSKLGMDDNLRRNDAWRSRTLSKIFWALYPHCSYLSIFIFVDCLYSCQQR